MMPSPSAAETPRSLPDCQPQRLGSDLFHALSQPLTGLCCSLELALQQNLSAEQYRDSVSRALTQAEQVSWLAMGIRELFEAGQAGEDCEVLAFHVAVASAIEDVQLVAEAAGVRIRWAAGAASRVRFEAHRLRRGLFHLLGFVIGWAARGSVVRIELTEGEGQTRLQLTASGKVPEPDSALRTLPPASAGNDPQGKLGGRLGLGIARAIFEAAGGSFRAECRLEEMSVEIRLPRVEDAIMGKP